MKSRLASPAFVLALVCLAAAGFAPARVAPAGPTAQTGSAVELPSERRLRNVRQLTFGGENAEAYFSPDGGALVFQSKRGSLGCDQIFTMRTDGSGVRMVSTGDGRTTCAYFLRGRERVLYSSTHLAGRECPPDHPGSEDCGLRLVSLCVQKVRRVLMARRSSMAR